MSEDWLDWLDYSNTDALRNVLIGEIIRLENRAERVRKILAQLDSYDISINETVLLNDKIDLTGMLQCPKCHSYMVKIIPDTHACNCQNCNNEWIETKFFDKDSE